MAIEKNIVYEALEKDRFNQSREDLREKLRMVSEGEMGRHGGLRRTILGYVVGERYDQAKEELGHYIEGKTVEYPSFGPRVEKFLRHSLELIQAIQTKRNFPGLGSLSLSKQQELNERVLSHFEELKQTLKTVERAEKEIKLSDHRSTAWVVRVFTHCLLILLMVGFLVSISNGLWYSSTVVFDALVEDFTTKVEHLLGWM
jgi:hypothetical protein